MKHTREEILTILQEQRPIDDVLFEVLASDKDFCQEILRVILEDEALIVEEVEVQKEEKNLVGRSVRLDALCILGDGTLCNVEVQRSNNDNNFKRIRYNASCITASETEPGSRFENVPNVIIVYISEFDILKQNKTTYHIDKIVRETGKKIEDGLQTVCVNCKVNDGSRIAKLMQLFKQSEVNEPEFPAFTNRMQYIKHSEGGKREMYGVAERIHLLGVEEGKQEGRQEGKTEMIQEMLLQDVPINVIAQYAKMDAERILKIQQDMIENGQL